MNATFLGLSNSLGIVVLTSVVMVPALPVDAAGAHEFVAFDEETDAIATPQAVHEVDPAPKSLLEVPNTILGRVVDESQQPLVRAGVLLIRVNRHDASSKCIAEKSSDADGRFRFDNVINIAEEFPNGKILALDALGDELFTLIIRAPGHVSESRTILPQQIARLGAVQMVRLPHAATLSGQITGSDGNPVADALVSVSDVVFDQCEGVMSDRTDASGNYEINDVAPFDMEKFLEDQEAQRRQILEARNTPHANLVLYLTPPLLTVKHPNFAVSKTDFNNVPGTMNIQLKPPAILEGRVVYADSGQPAAGAFINVTSSTSRELVPAREQALSEFRAAIRADSAGKYRFGNLPAGTYDVWAERAGWVNFGVSRIATAAETTTAVPDLILTKGGILKIRLLDAKTREPLKFQSDAQLVVVARPLDMSVKRVFLPQSVSVNSNGQFEVRVSPGRNDIQFVALESAGFRVHANSTNTHTQTTIADGESAELPLVVSAAKVNASLADEKTAALIEEATNLIRNQQFQAAIDKLNPVVAEYPALALPWIVRAEAYENLGQMPQAKEQYEQLLKSDPPKPLSILARNNLAFLLATEIDENLRDGKRAVKLASNALDLSGGDQPDVLDTLSAAYAETGAFEQAVKTIQKAIQLAPDNESFRKHLDLYQSNRALRVTRGH